MDLNPTYSHRTIPGHSPQLEHALEVIAAALSAAIWTAYRGAIVSMGGEPDWRWQVVCRQPTMQPGSGRWPHQIFPTTCRRLADKVARAHASAHEIVLGGEAASDNLSLHRLAWVVVQPGGRCDCFDFLRDESEAGYSRSDQHVLSVFAREFIEPLLSNDELHSDHRELELVCNALSRRQREVLAGLVAGQSVKEVARHLNLSPHTVNDYVKAIYRHFDVCSRGELLAVVHGRIRQARRSEIT